MKTEQVAWQKSIFAVNKFYADLRRRNLVRDIFYEGYNAAQIDIADALDALPRSTDSQTKLDYELTRYAAKLRGK